MTQFWMLPWNASELNGPGFLSKIFLKWPHRFDWWSYWFNASVAILFKFNNSPDSITKWSLQNLPINRSNEGLPTFQGVLTFFDVKGKSNENKLRAHKRSFYSSSVNWSEWLCDWNKIKFLNIFDFDHIVW